LLFEAEINPVTDKYSEKELTPQAHEKAIAFLSKSNLLENINALLEQNGIVGEEENRLLLFILASSYKMPYLMHGLVQGSSGEGKSHLINGIAQCMPQEDVMNMTRITSKSLYHYRDKELINKLIVIQDFDGLDEEAQYAFREMQSAKFLTSSTVVKDIFGNNRGRMKQVQAHFASLTTTTKAEVYYDNMSRSIILGVDESQAQTLRIIEIQNRKIAGKSNNENQEQATQLLRNAMRVLKSYEVVNPFADKLMLPLEAKMLRRLNNQFQNFVSQITILHQYQRKTDTKNRLIATKGDIKLGVDIFFSSIIIKVDELDKSTRQFFENLKGYVKSQNNGTTHRFTSREIRQKLNISKTSAFRYIQLLLELEYIQTVEGSVNKGFKYIIGYWDNMEKLKSKIKQELSRQVEQF
jgi:predicted GTPase